MNRFLRILFSGYLVLNLLLLTLCNKETTNQPVDCSRCFPVPPDSGFLSVVLTINHENLKIPVKVYEGNLEDNHIKYVDTFTHPNVRILMPAGHHYAVTATYIRNNDTVIAVDGTTLEVKKAVGQCPKACYVVMGGYLDLQLRK